MVFQVRAVLALIVLGALAEIVAGPIVALGPILAGVRLTVIYVQLQVSGAGQRYHYLGHWELTPPSLPIHPPVCRDTMCITHLHALGITAREALREGRWETVASGK